MGYGMGQPATISVTTAQPDVNPIDIAVSTSSGLFLTGGVGVRKSFGPRVTGLMTVRTAMIMGTPYSNTALMNRDFIPLPILFNMGAEFPF